MSNDVEMTPFEHATIDCIKTIIEMLHAKGVATHSEFAAQFEFQRKATAQANPHGMVVFFFGWSVL